MPFDAERFKRAGYTPRVEEVPMPVLAEFFGEGEAAVFVVRGLSANELHLAIEAGARNRNVDAVVKAIASSADQVANIRQALGMSTDTPGEISKRLQMLVSGAVSPEIDDAVAAKLAETFPVEFYDLTNRITALTGQGASRVKPLASSQPTPT